jgi:ABC-2 type transport system permease protein
MMFGFGLVQRLCHPGASMQPFWEIVRLSLRRQLTYRAAIWAGLATNVFFGLLRAAVLIALYGARDTLAGMSLQDAVTYSGLAQSVIAYLSIFGWYDVMDSVYTGEVSADLLRPMGYLRFWLAVDLGRALVSLLLRGVPIMLLYALVVRITVPTSAGQWILLALVIALSWLVSFAWRFLVNLAAFWTPNARGVGRLAFFTVTVLSGFYMPLRFYPAWFVALCRATPFPALVNTPVEVYLGLLDGPAIAWALLHQVAWAVVLFGLAQAVLSRGVRRLVVQGG